MTTSQQLPADTEEICIKSDFDGNLAVRIECPGYYHRRQRARAVTVYGDGRIEYHDTATQPQLLDAALKLLTEMYDSSPCRIDHNGECQEHGWIPGPDEQCGQVQIRELLTAAGRITADGEGGKP